MNLQHRQTKIQEKRKQTSFRDFVMEIASRYTINLNRNKGVISRYPDTDRTGQIISKKEYDQLGDQMNNRAYNASESFIKQLYHLRKDIKRPSTITFIANENVEYADVIFGAKNAHLSFTVGANVENILYSTIVYTNCKNIVNCVKVTDNSENIYYSKDVAKGYNVFYSKYINNCSDVRFSSNLIGCKHCIGCDNLINQSYCIGNQQLTKEEYQKQKQEIMQDKIGFSNLFHAVNNIAVNYEADNCSGSGIRNSSNITNGYCINRTVDGRNVVFIDGINHAERYYDVFEAGVDSDDLCAASNTGTNSFHVYCSTQIETSTNVFYCYHLENCSFCLGCIGLKNKSYCILNKQYTKEEWYEKVDEIFAQMDADGTLGKFFPATMNPFYFNDTAAYLIDPSFTKEEVTAKGYLWRDEPIKVDIPEGAQVIKTSELDQYEGWKNVSSGTIVRHSERSNAESKNLGQQSNHGGDPSQAQDDKNDGVGRARYIDESICKKVILDEAGNAYRIIPMELEFLIKHGLPLPRKHWLDRMKENFRIT